jgi:hypothetical protein
MYVSKRLKKAAVQFIKSADHELGLIYPHPSERAYQEKVVKYLLALVKKDGGEIA